MTEYGRQNLMLLLRELTRALSRLGVETPAPDEPKPKRKRRAPHADVTDGAEGER